MGVGAASAISSNLIVYGMSATIPVAVVGSGTTPAEKLVVGKLETLSQLISESKIIAPAIIIIGYVVEQSRLEVLSLADQARASHDNIIQSGDRPGATGYSEMVV